MESNGSALATVDRTSALTVRVQAMEITLREETKIRAMVKSYVAENMVEDVDYGKIPGTDKPTLLKPGAEKLTSLFRCTPKAALITKEEDFERGFFNYMFRIRLVSIDTKEVLAEGFGSANSREGRYRWRNANRKCPHCQKETVFKSNRPGEGFYCWGKKGGCGAKFPEDAPAIVKQEIGRVENDDIATLANTILKMAKKRALVDGAIALAHCSDMFNQDLDDILEVAQEESRAPKEQPKKSEPARQSKPSQSSPPAGNEPPHPADGPPPPGSSPEAKAVQQVVNRAQEDKRATVDIRRRADALYKASLKAGASLEQFRQWTTDVLRSDKKSPEWTLADVEMLEKAFALAQEAVAEKPDAH